MDEENKDSNNKEEASEGGDKNGTTEEDTGSVDYSTGDKDKSAALSNITSVLMTVSIMAILLTL